MLQREDLLQSGGRVHIGASNPAPAIAMLRGAKGSDTLLRVAVYPAEQIAYCGLWYDGDLLVGGSIVPTMMLTTKLFLAGRIEVLGRSNLEVRLIASWDLETNVAISSAVNADAEILDGRGMRCERPRLPRRRPLALQLPCPQLPPLDDGDHFRRRDHAGTNNGRRPRG